MRSELRPPPVAIHSMRSTAHTFTAPGSTPVGRFVSGHCSPPSPRGIPQGAHAGPCVTGRANRLWAFPLSVAFPRSESGDPFPGGSPPLQVEAPENVSATHRLLQTCLLRTGPFQGMLLTSESGL